MNNRAVISVGSNIDPDHFIPLTLHLLRNQMDLLSVSTWSVTKAVGYTDQEDFVNGAILIETELEFNPLNMFLKQIEKEMGRIKTSNKFGPRVIDLDVSVWNRRIIDDDVCERKFLKKSLLELLPDLKF